MITDGQMFPKHDALLRILAPMIQLSIFIVADRHLYVNPAGEDLSVSPAWPIQRPVDTPDL